MTASDPESAESAANVRRELGVRVGGLEKGVVVPYFKMLVTNFVSLLPCLSLLRANFETPTISKSLSRSPFPTAFSLLLLSCF